MLFYRVNIYNMSGFKTDTMASILGGGIPGMQSKGGLIGGGAGPTGSSGMVGSSARSRNRKILRQSFGNKQLSMTIVSPLCAASNKCRELNPTLKKPNKITPFRAAMNAGDINGTIGSAASSSLPGVNQITGNVPIWLVWSGVKNNGDALYTGNPKKVYDSSDYVRFKKLQSINRTYNDKSFGGDQFNASQVSIASVRRF